MNLRLLILLALCFIATNATAQPDVDALIEDMTNESFVPTQKKLATRITDALIEQAQTTPLPALIANLKEENQPHLRQVSWQGTGREIHVATLWHQNRFQPVQYEQQACTRQTCYAINVYPIIQWQKADGGWAARSLYTTEGEWPQVRKEGAQAEVTEMHALKSPDSELYLLLGEQAGNREPAYMTALVIAFDDDELDLDYSAFKQRYPLLEAWIYDNRRAYAYRDHRAYDADTQRLSFTRLGGDFIPGLSRRKAGHSKVMVAQDSSRTQHSVLNARGEGSIELEFVDGHFVPVE